MYLLFAHYRIRMQYESFDRNHDNSEFKKRSITYCIFIYCLNSCSLNCHGSSLHSYTLIVLRSKVLSNPIRSLQLHFLSSKNLNFYRTMHVSTAYCPNDYGKICPTFSIAIPLKLLHFNNSNNSKSPCPFI